MRGSSAARTRPGRTMPSLRRIGLEIDVRKASIRRSCCRRTATPGGREASVVLPMPHSPSNRTCPLCSACASFASASRPGPRGGPPRGASPPNGLMPRATISRTRAACPRLDRPLQAADEQEEKAQPRPEHPGRPAPHLRDRLGNVTANRKAKGRCTSDGTTMVTCMRGEVLNPSSCAQTWSSCGPRPGRRGGNCRNPEPLARGAASTPLELREHQESPGVAVPAADLEPLDSVRRQLDDAALAQAVHREPTDRRRPDVRQARHQAVPRAGQEPVSRIQRQRRDERAAAEIEPAG